MLNFNKEFPAIIFLMGPTSSGKTDLAINLSKVLPCEIISVDSVSIYRGLDIGTAKPSPEILAKYPHKLVDILDPTDSYSASAFRQDALKEIKNIHSRGNIPLLVGGTMLYYKILVSGMADIPNSAPKIRREILEEAKKFGWDFIYKQLSIVDFQSSIRIHHNDKQRITRALEVYRMTGKTIGTHYQKQKEKNAQNQTKLPYKILSLAIAPRSRQEMYSRIETRVDHMLTLGLIDEVSLLKKIGTLNTGMPSMRAVGYRQVWSYLEGKSLLTDTKEAIKIASRRLAKRQITWLRSWDDLYWLDSLANDNIRKIQRLLSLIKNQSNVNLL